MSDYPTYRAVLLDRDGVINDNPNWYIFDWSEFVWLPGALEALCSLHEQGIAVSVVTNQGCIARGMATLEQIDAIHERMMREVELAGGKISAVYTCPHYECGCECGKPAPGNVFRAMRDLGVTPEETCFVGDRLGDIQAAYAAGIDGYLLRSGYWGDLPTAMQSATPPLAIFDDLAQFVEEVVGAPVAV